MAKTNRLEEMLDELGQKMDQFIEEIKEQGEELSEEMREEMENLKEKMNTATDDSKGFTGKAKERWDNAKGRRRIQALFACTIAVWMTEIILHVNHQQGGLFQGQLKGRSSRLHSQHDHGASGSFF